MFFQKIRCSGCFCLLPSQLLFFLLPAHLSCQGSHGGPSLQVVALVGGDVILPCFLSTPADASYLVLEWGRPDLTPGFIHVWRENKEDDRDKQPSYVGRTFLSRDKLKHGDVSLTVSRVTLSDEGTYRCLIPQLGEASFVHLTVGSVSTAIIEVSSDSSSRVVLHCHSAGWYPEPEVFWLYGKGNHLSARPTETVRGPDGLYNVSSRVTVEKGNNRFVCRIQQKNIKQIRETHIHVPDSSSHFSFSKILAVVCLAMISAVLFD
ncbi:butyrophilin subfamily 1 member A1-like [Melanotaenia boesemani]|uniref:butyrophilin subfamily 1 member A1-like n=1 Tax=Melanotaenia boesemani TaxID=1250792 RepID=UPI001C03B565|nr:butyrophilin subfamily 1 member A1-like [Melanotaenia boesemani]XP_041841805.1 butyrophilin subfamily 1 member A1-like [Melanotaenia boesemani]